MTTEQFIILVKLILILQIAICIVMLFRYFDTRPDKETRKRIKELAKEKNRMPHEVTNRILKSYFEAYDHVMSQQIRHDDSIVSYEEWKASHAQKHIVKPKKIHPEE